MAANAEIRRLRKIVQELVLRLGECRTALLIFYDPAAKHDRTMRKVGVALAKSEKSLTKARMELSAPQD